MLYRAPGPGKQTLLLLSSPAQAASGCKATKSLVFGKGCCGSRHNLVRAGHYCSRTEDGPLRCPASLGNEESGMNAVQSSVLLCDLDQVALTLGFKFFISNQRQYF